MKEKKTGESYVLDAYALLAFLEAEEGGELVKKLLSDSKVRFFISAINLGEVYYTILRERGRASAENFEFELVQAKNIRIVDATWDRAKIAGEFKARGRISYADCFAAALALEKNAPLLTGDREFERVADKIKIVWLTEKALT
ncbi:type II toxin-antitoxin system VapC family toxin [Desulfofundulus thermobenzoicus]|uniref:type II toxin-antitoxin system VapC family toxin n=1 Tax=Desulfofundulus thermobenzoicus TaxID=29376 RepID=UPI00128F3282|nr:type II toxin-antitoxin system VapC family toxin [Desulfofundulus thermobenzoicus]